MNRKFDKKALEEKILQLCLDAKSAKELSLLLNINLNTLRSKYIYPMYKKGLIKRANSKYTVINANI